MSKPFQFSIRRALTTVVLTAVAAKLFVAYWPERYNLAGPVLFFSGCAVGGTAIGLLFQRPVWGAMAGIAIGIAAFCCCPFLWWRPGGYL